MLPRAVKRGMCWLFGLSYNWKPDHKIYGVLFYMINFYSILPVLFSFLEKGGGLGGGGMSHKMLACKTVPRIHDGRTVNKSYLPASLRVHYEDTSASI